MDSLQARRLAEARTALAKTEAQRDAAITKLVRMHGRIKTLARSIARYEIAVAAQKEKSREQRKAKLANGAAVK